MCDFPHRIAYHNSPVFRDTKRLMQNVPLLILLFGSGGVEGIVIS